MRQPYGYDTKKASQESATINDEVSLTVQSEKDDCDINVIAARFGLTGSMPDNWRTPTYGDFSGVTDYQSAVEAIRNANEAFYQLPAPIRAEFENDPQKMMEWTRDNGDEQIKAMAEEIKKGKTVPLTTAEPVKEG